MNAGFHCAGCGSRFKHGDRVAKIRVLGTMCIPCADKEKLKDVLGVGVAGKNAGSVSSISRDRAQRRLKELERKRILRPKAKPSLRRSLFLVPILMLLRFLRSIPLRFRKQAKPRFLLK